jgi:hypothetical protein
MRDAAFSRWPGSDFALQPPFAFEPATFESRPAAHWFADALGYYPGVEPVAPELWRTRQWDASVVLPATVQYPVRGAGYPLGAGLDRVVASRTFQGTTESLTYRTNAILGGIRLPGGDGHPGSVDGHYGWNAWIVHQTDSAAQVVVWNSRCAHLDDDADGSANWEEAIAGTDPADARSRLRVTQLSPAQSQGLRLEWTSATNRVYRLWRAGSLGVDFGLPIAADLPATPPHNAFVDPQPPATGPAFYRVEVQ